MLPAPRLEAASYSVEREIEGRPDTRAQNALQSRASDPMLGTAPVAQPLTSCP